MLFSNYQRWFSGIVLLLSAQFCFADVLATHARNNLFLVGDNESVTDPYMIPLNNRGDTVMNFTTVDPNQKVVIEFNAFCGVKSQNAALLAVSILLDSAPTNPQSGALCSIGALTASVVTAIGRVANPGQHSIAIAAQYVLPPNTQVNGDQWLLGQATVVVEK